jgi:hypothetical protein
MKKFIFAVVMMFVVIPFSVNAEECTDDMVASYLPQANNVYMQYVATSNPDTYKIYVYGLSTGISYDGINGTEFSDGYYAYASAGDTFTISVKISDGSVCALRTVKTVSILVPANATVTQPVVEPTTPSTNTNTSDGNTSTNSNTTSPSTNINSGSTSSSSNSGTDDSNSDSSGSSTDVKTNEDTSADTSSGVEDTKDNEIGETKEVLTSKDNTKNSRISILKYIIASAIFILMIGSGIIIYFKKVKGAKK